MCRQCAVSFYWFWIIILLTFGYQRVAKNRMFVKQKPMKMFSKSITEIQYITIPMSCTYYAK